MRREDCRSKVSFEETHAYARDRGPVARIVKANSGPSFLERGRSTDNSKEPRTMMGEEKENTESLFDLEQVTRYEPRVFENANEVR